MIVKNGLYKLNDIAETKLFGASDTTRDYSTLTIDHFKKPYKSELRAFIHVRLFKDASIPSGQASSIPSNKGNLEGAKQGEENNLIRVAFETRNEAMKMTRPSTDEEGNVIIMNGVVVDDGDEVDVEENEDPPRLIVEYPTVTPPRVLPTEQLPSHYLQSEAYLKLALKSLKGTFRIESYRTEDDDLKFANKLGRTIHRRLIKHIRTKIADSTKHNHPALLFVRDNLNRFTAFLCFYGQGRKSVVMNENSCLLQHPSRGGFIMAKDEALEGSYLHYSNEEFKWIRSGKATGSDATENGLVKRNEKGHRKKAATASLVDGECFYTLYPSRSNPNQLPNRMGYFEDLILYCGFSFIRSDAAAVEGLVSTVEGKGLFDWSVYINQLENANMRGAKTLKEKQLIVVSYFFEMCYDICLSPRHNVSNNPGFESVIGVFNNAKTM